MTWTLLIMQMGLCTAPVYGFKSAAACEYAQASVQRYMVPDRPFTLMCVPTTR